MFLFISWLASLANERSESLETKKTGVYLSFSTSPVTESFLIYSARNNE